MELTRPQLLLLVAAIAALLLTAEGRCDSYTADEVLEKYNINMFYNRFPKINGQQSISLSNVSLTAPTSTALNDHATFTDGLNQSLSMSCSENKGHYYILEPTDNHPEYAHCYWGYICDYDSNRIPQYLCRAQCKQSCSGCPVGYSCQPVFYKTAVLKLKNPDNCYPFYDSTAPKDWQLSVETVPVSCACKTMISA